MTTQPATNTTIADSGPQDAAPESVAEPARLWTVPEAIGVLRVSRDYLYSMLRAGKIEHVKFGRKTLFRPEALEAFIRQNTQQQLQPRDDDDSPASLN